jgi:acyl-CoA synthetase (AMP-forming)/AMP-acid ligase II
MRGDDVIVGLGDSLASLIPDSQRRCIIGDEGDGGSRQQRQPLTHAGLRSFVQSFTAQLEHAQIAASRRSTVCVALPNGPESAVALLAFSAWCVYAPISAALAPAELTLELQGLRPAALVVMGSPATGTANNDAPAPTPVECAAALSIPVVTLHPDARTCGLFALHATPAVAAAAAASHVGGNDGRDVGVGVHCAEEQVRPSGATPSEWVPASAQDVAVLLHTSGTTKRPKLVPLTHAGLSWGALRVGRAIELTDTDVCVNPMPLHHLHGMAVNVLASVLAGAAVVCPGPAGAAAAAVAGGGGGGGGGSVSGRRLLELLRTHRASWYSATPTHHLALVEQVEKELAAAGDACCDSRSGLASTRQSTKIIEAPWLVNGGHGASFSPAACQRSGVVEGLGALRLIRNCSAALPPALAARLRTRLGCVVLPSYAMTECLPIASHSPADMIMATHGAASGGGGGDDDDERFSSVGRAAGPEIMVMSEPGARGDTAPVPPGGVGEVCVRGPCLMAGYARSAASTADHAEEEAGCPGRGLTPAGWLRTGDLGRLDPDGYLFLTGRCKEMINRGGESLSPLAIEEAVLAHPSVAACACFAAPHRLLGEAVGVLAVAVGEGEPAGGGEAGVAAAAAAPEGLVPLAEIRAHALAHGRLSARSLPEVLVWSVSHAGAGLEGSAAGGSRVTGKLQRVGKSLLPRV